ncbi:hypothetical protein Sango_1888600 [Sesamum angolense]|uniref:RNase H type-1 domain-containing protein n=1 Tax=Sesamum angolense TaxID=2727404 RepID=A0AAE1WIM3_9LAMI|nr:hypothetical protein Sango_1888600 [Sesamum angolense]
MRIVQDIENQTYVLDKSLPMTLPEGSTPEERVTFESTKMTKGSSVEEHGIKMLFLVEKLEDLQAGLDNDTNQETVDSRTRIQSLNVHANIHLVSSAMDRSPSPHTVCSTDLDEHTVEGRFTSGCRNGFIFHQTVPRAPSIVRWRAPSPSWFKLNTDGSSLGNPGTSVLAELTAVWRGLELALTHRLTLLVVEVDATTVISLLQSRASGKWEVQHLIMRIVHLQQLLVADIQHVFREANGAADHLAKEAASLQLTRVIYHDDITGVLCGILCLDRWGVPHLRRGDDGFTTWARSSFSRSLVWRHWFLAVAGASVLRLWVTGLGSVRQSQLPAFVSDLIEISIEFC